MLFKYACLFYKMLKFALFKNDPFTLKIKLEEKLYDLVKTVTT